MLKEIGKSMYGTTYAMQGSVPFNFPDTQNLQWGDVIIDNNGRGMHLYVNECSTCKKKFLGGLLIISFECDRCRS